MRYAVASEVDWVRDRLGAPYSGVTAIVPSGYLVLRGDVGASGEDWFAV